MNRKKWVAGILTAAVLIGVAGVSQLQLTAAASDSVQATEASARYTAATEVNTIRKTLGMPAFSQDTLLDQAAESHSLYMETASRVSFEEVPGASGFTGGYPTDRATYAGYDGSLVMEYDNYRMVSFSDYIAWCMQDPCTRGALLSPGYSDIGFARSGYYYCMVLGGDGYTGEPKTAVYPFAGQEEVENIAVQDLTDVPEAVLDLEAETIGMPVTVHFYCTGVEDLRFDNISCELLDTEKEQPIETLAVMPGDAHSVWNALILYPLTAYEPSMRYTVTAAFDVYDGETFLQRVEEKWSFTSAGSETMSGMPREAVMQELLEALYAPEEIAAEWMDTVDDPEGFTTREQAIVWMIDLLNAYVPEVMDTITLDYKDTFEDINQCEEDNRDKVQTAYQMRLVEDQGRGILNPKAFITRAELNKMTTRLMNRFRIVWDDFLPKEELEEEPEQSPEESPEPGDRPNPDEEREKTPDPGRDMKKE